MVSIVFKESNKLLLIESISDLYTSKEFIKELGESAAAGAMAGGAIGGVITGPATYFGNWERQTLTTMKSHPDTRYIRVVEEGDSFLPKSLKDVANLEHQTVPEFIKFWQKS